MEEVIDDPQARLNDMLVEVAGHTHGRRQAINSPFWLRDAPKVPARLGPELGAQGREILREAGYGEADIERLVARGVLAV